MDGAADRQTDTWPQEAAALSITALPRKPPAVLVEEEGEKVGVKSWRSQRITALHLFYPWRLITLYVSPHSGIMSTCNEATRHQFNGTAAGGQTDGLTAALEG